MMAIEGIEHLLKTLETISNPADYLPKVEKACLLVEGAAKQKAPIGRTGNLRRSIHTETSIEGTKAIGAVIASAEYAPYIEYGTGLFAEAGNGRQDVPWSYQDEEGIWHTTSGQPPCPFLRPALTENKSKVKKIIKEGLGNA